jgi:hypothetical protein
MEHPEHLDAKGWGGVDTCPTVFSYAKKPPYCSDETMTNNERCTKCWDREIPEKKEEPAYNPVEKAYQLLIDYYHNGKTTNFDQVIRYLGEAMERASNAKVATAYQQLVNFLYLRVSIDFNEVIGYLGEVLDDHAEEGEPVQFEYRSSEPIGKVKDIHEENGGITAVIEPIIKDSGDRTQFESGAVRDMREGKGRCDLMPLEVAADLLADRKGRDPILFDISCFLDKNDEQGTAWLKAALDNFSNKAYEGQNATMFLEVAKHFEEGAKKYGENNWQKGIPVHCYIDSAVRHYLKWLRGDKDEPHDRAFVWNLMCCIWEVDYREKEKD